MIRRHNKLLHLAWHKEPQLDQMLSVQALIYSKKQINKLQMLLLLAIQQLQVVVVLELLEDLAKLKEVIYLEIKLKKIKHKLQQQQMHLLVDSLD